MIIISWVIYIPLQILFIPVTILGALLVAYKQILVSSRLGLSQTAIEVINGRWTMHVFGLRDDESTASLVSALPNTSLFGLWMCLFPLWVKYKISGKHAIYPRAPEPGSETMADLIIARTLYFDRIIERATGQAEQFVVMGAGYDMRAYGNLKQQKISFFELDQPSVQQHKLASLDSAGITSDHVKFVSVDFGNEDAFEKLVESGFDTSKKTVFLWEGVTLYLSEEEVRKTIQDIRNNAAVGSVLLADLYAERFLAFAQKGARKKTLDQTGEGLDFGLNLSTNYAEVLSDFVQSESMSVGETFFMGRNNDKGPFVVVVEMIID
ncbi:MAG: hypothetical protein COB20_11735 [SAR86 cluster bacterium]|uniref:S-adenosyl-L-methionine-dependent methyltransferase n=1 Tax=SAR86 cluster bacterium TaxID=2030880 RepID=A0A2A4X0F7_9GAMM|nr:MAG: hypothetical protein COB20_11735 [SAR86 cluster bacterium]